MKIEFVPTDEQTESFVSPPIPAKDVLAEWYKKMPRFHGGQPKIINGAVENNSIKACYPFYDAMASGYIQKTWCDIHISFDGSSARYNFSCGPEIIGIRDSVNIKLSDDYWPIEFVWKVRWSIKTPPGWGYMMVSPSNRFDLPFHSPSGIVDSDVFNYVEAGDYPFYIKKSFNDFIIPEGTPMYQIIPFKRENWKSKTLKLDENKIKKNTFQLKKNFIGGYKKFFYQKKIYE